MDFNEVLFKRRSIRKYQDQQVEEEKKMKLLKAAMAAPSAGNQQPWHFIVVEDDSRKEDIREIHPYSDMLAEAPLAILVCGDKREERHKGFWVQDCSAAVQNMLLMAENLGLGAVWLGVYPREERAEKFQELFSLPKEVIPLAVVAVGHPAEESGKVDRFKEGRIHQESWQN